MALAEEILDRPKSFVYSTVIPTVVSGTPIRINPRTVTSSKKATTVQSGYSRAVHRSFLLGLFFVALSVCASFFGVITEQDGFSLAGALILPLGLFGLMNWISLAHGERSKKLDR